MSQRGQVAWRPGAAAAQAEPNLTELLDPVALEARLAEARARRAEVMARRAKGEPMPPPRVRPLHAHRAAGSAAPRPAPPGPPPLVAIRPAAAPRPPRLGAALPEAAAAEAAAEPAAAPDRRGVTVPVAVLVGVAAGVIGTAAALGLLKPPAPEAFPPEGFPPVAALEAPAPAASSGVPPLLGPPAQGAVPAGFPDAALEPVGAPDLPPAPQTEIASLLEGLGTPPSVAAEAPGLRAPSGLPAVARPGPAALAAAATALPDLPPPQPAAAAPEPVGAGGPEAAVLVAALAAPPAVGAPPAAIPLPAPATALPPGFEPAPAPAAAAPAALAALAPEDAPAPRGLALAEAAALAAPPVIGASPAAVPLASPAPPAFEPAPAGDVAVTSPGALAALVPGDTPLPRGEPGLAEVAPRAAPPIVGAWPAAIPVAAPLPRSFDLAPVGEADPEAPGQLVALTPGDAPLPRGGPAPGEVAALLAPAPEATQAAPRLAALAGTETPPAVAFGVRPLPAAPAALAGGPGVEKAPGAGDDRRRLWALVRFAAGLPETRPPAAALPASWAEAAAVGYPLAGTPEAPLAEAPAEPAPAAPAVRTRQPARAAAPRGGRSANAASQAKVVERIMLESAVESMLRQHLRGK